MASASTNGTATYKSRTHLSYMRYADVALALQIGNCAGDFEQPVVGSGRESRLLDGGPTVSTLRSPVAAAPKASLAVAWPFGSVKSC